MTVLPSEAHARCASASWALAAASLPYALAVRLRHSLYDRRIFTEHTAAMPVVSVGGLEAGGTGKTPMVALVLRRLLAAGLKPGLLTRGYRRQERGLSVRRVGGKPNVTALGDEAAMLVGGGLDVAVAACAHRLRGAQALAHLGCNAAVMDDGLSHRALARSLNVVMLRGELPLHAGRLLPWGSLREPVGSLRRAHLVVVHFREGQSSAATQAQFRGAIAQASPDAAVLFSHVGAAEVRAQGGTRVATPGRVVVAAAGTARPQEIPVALEALGMHLRAFYPLADHHPFGAATREELNRCIRRCGAEALVVTAKDRVKLPEEHMAAPLWTLLRPLVLEDPEDVLGRALQNVFAGYNFSLPRNTSAPVTDTFF